MQASLRQAVRRLGARECPRPVLRGRPVSVQPDALVIDLVEGRGPLSRCVAWVARHEADLRHVWARDQPPPDLIPKLDQACPGLLARVARVARFRGVCSPYRPGQRRLPKFLALVRLQQAAVALAVGRAEKAPDEAALTLLDLLRFHQDLERGGTPWIWPYVLRSALTPAVLVLGRILASGRLDSAARQRVDAGLATLLTTEPSPAFHVLGERLYVELHTFLGPLGRSATEPGAAAGLLRGAQGHLLAWLAYRQRAQRFQGACLPGTAARVCHRRFLRLEGEPRASLRELQERWAQFEWWLSTGSLRGAQGDFDRAAARQAALAVLGHRGGTRHSDHLLRASQRGFYLTALRLHLRVLDAQARLPDRPLLVEEVEALARHLPEPFADAPLRVQGNPGHVILAPPTRLAPRQEPALRYVMRWPVRRPPADPR